MEPAPPHIEIPISDDPKKENPSINSNLSKTSLSPRGSKEYINAEILNKENQINNFVKDNNIYPPSDIKDSASQKNPEKNIEIVEPQKSLNLNFDLKININMRSKFMLKVFGILLTQLIFTFVLVLICQIKQIKPILLEQKILCIVLMSLSSLGFLVIFIIFIWKPTIMRKVPQNYICIFMVTIFVTILLVYISILYPVHYVVGAVSFVIAISLAIFFISLFNKIDIKYLGMALIILLACGLNYGLLAIIYRSYYLHFVYCLIGGIIYTLFIAYDTISIRDHFSIDDYAFAALTLYLDIVRLFIQILKILGSASRKK